MNALLNDTQKEYSASKEQLEGLDKAVARVEYEELSSKVYESEKEKNLHLSDRDMIDMERENLQEEAAKTQEKLHILACARGQQSVNEEKGELELLREKIAVARKQGEDLEPERRALGFSLKCFFEGQLRDNRGQQNIQNESAKKAGEEADKKAQKIQELEEKIRDCFGKKGKLESQIEAYSRVEEQYNSKYQEELRRNILGSYEAGTLQICQQIYEQDLEKAVRERTESQKKWEADKETIRGQERRLEDKKEALIHKKIKIQKQTGRYQTYEKELEDRKAVLKYLDMEERYLLDRERILDVSGRKLRELEELRRNLEKEEDTLEKEYTGLTSGKVLELPEELENELKNLDIHAVYGMEWLKKNGYSQKKNQELVRRNPFLPYALILTRQEMEKLGRNGKNICTSFPVPIVEREKLEEVQEKYADKIVRFPGISFYILFNENLLDEEKLQAMIWEKRQKLEKIGQAVLLRKKEYAEYFQRQEMIKNQTVTKESWQEVQETLEKLEEEKKRLEKEIRDDSQSLEKLKKDHDELQAFIARAGMEIQRQRQKLEDFKQLKRDYDSYESNREVLEKCKKEEARYQENQKLARDRQRKLLEEKKTLEYSINMLGREEERLSEKYARYAAYENAEQNFHIDESLSADQMEARYEAITSVLSQELKDLEAQEKKVAGRFQRAMDDLEYQQKKYKLKPSQWQNVFYDRKEETHQEVILEDFQRKIQTKDLQWNEADKKGCGCAE